MSKIDISIWGIRAGFEDSGIFHSHNFAEVKELQKDKFRGLADLSRPKNSYMINNTSAHTLVTIIHTDIFEFSVSGNPRSGYIAISLIFDKNKSLAASPRIFLQQFVQWYKKVQGNTRVNNFTAEQIQGITNQLSLVESNLRDVPGKKAIAFKSEADIDGYLTGGSKYVPFAETIFYDANGVNFEQSGLNNEIISLTNIIDSVEREEEKRRIEEDNLRAKQHQIAEKERELSELIELGRIDQMIEVFDKFQLNYLIKASIRNSVETEKQKRAELIQSNEEQFKADEIYKLVRENNYELACAKFDLLKDRNRLPEKESRMIAKYKSDLRKQKDEAKAKQLEIERKDSKKRTIKLYSIIGSASILILLAVASFILETPLSMYDNDNDLVANSIDSCPEVEGEKKYIGCPDTDGDGFEDSKDECIDEPGELNGCPDKDGDGINDKDEIENKTDPKKADTDGDGLKDKEDDCPLEKGKEENKGCEEKATDVTPIPPISDDGDNVNKIVIITYKDVQYKIKKGFTTKGGMKYNNSGWRYYNNIWENEKTPGSEDWIVAKNNDIEFVLAKNATRIVVTPPLPKVIKTKPNKPSSTITNLPEISNIDKKALQILYNKIMDSDLALFQNSIKKNDLSDWKYLYQVHCLDDNGKLKIQLNNQIKKWNSDIMTLTLKKD